MQIFCLARQTDLKSIHFYLPINKEENEPFIVEFDKTIIATTFPTKPNNDMIVSKMPTVTSLKGVTSNSMIVVIFGQIEIGCSVILLSNLGNMHFKNALKFDFGKL